MAAVFDVTTRGRPSEPACNEIIQGAISRLETVRQRVVPVSRVLFPMTDDAISMWTVIGVDNPTTNASKSSAAFAE